MPALRLATRADVPALSRLINAAYAVEAFFLLGARTDQRSVEEKIDAPDGAFLVIDGLSPGALTGAVYVELRGRRGYFGLLAVDPARQGEGLGRVLVEAAEAHCRAAGCTVLDLDVVNLRTELPPFYTKFGYRTVSTAPFPDPEKLKQPAHLIVMSKLLG